MEFLSWLLMEDVQRIRATFSAGGPYGAPALLGALIFAGAYYVGRRRARSRSMSLRAFTRTIFAKRILLHPSSLIDFRLWTINAVVLGAAYGLLAVGNLACRDLVDGIAVGMQEADGNRRRPGLLDRGNGVSERRLIERRRHLAVSLQSFAYAKTLLARHQQMKTDLASRDSARFGSPTR